MGFARTGSKNNFTLELLSLKRPEMEELLTFLFRKMGYIVEQAQWEGDILYFHIVKKQDHVAHHALACWTGGKRILGPDFLQSFLKNPPINLKQGTSFERGFFLSPYEFHVDFRAEAERNTIALINGQLLSDLLAENQLTYYFPSFLEIIGRWLWKNSPVLIPGLLLIYGIFLYLTLRPDHVSAIHPPKPTLTSSPSLNSNTGTSLLNPTFAVNIQEPNELYKRMDLPTGSAVATRQPDAIRRNETPENAQIGQPTPTAVSRPEQALTLPPPANMTHRNPSPKNLRPMPRRPYQAPTESAGRVINKYNKVVDLEEKYFSIARDLERSHHGAKAKAYYQKYLRIAPNGDYADSARQALKRLK